MLRTLSRRCSNQHKGNPGGWPPSTQRADIAEGAGLASRYAHREKREHRGKASATEANGIWTRARLMEAGVVEHDACPRCRGIA